MIPHFPTICVDNFYDDPDKVRNFALSQNFYHTEDGKWPGMRTMSLADIDRNFFDEFCHRLFSLYFDLDSTDMRWEVSTGFQLIEPFSEDKNSPKNKGWIHHDTQAVFGGIIYLNDDCIDNTGTHIYKLKEGYTREQTYGIKYLETKKKYYKDGIDDNFDNIILEFSDMFEEVATFKNVYNRLVSFDGTTFHGVNSFYTKGIPRLTQYFFVDKLEMNSQTPLDKMRKYGNFKI